MSPQRKGSDSEHVAIAAPRKSATLIHAQSTMRTALFVLSGFLPMAAFCSDPFGHGFCPMQRARNQ